METKRNQLKRDLFKEFGFHDEAAMIEVNKINIVDLGWEAKSTFLEIAKKSIRIMNYSWKRYQIISWNLKKIK